MISKCQASPLEILLAMLLAAATLGCGGGGSGSVAVTNPIPTISALSPSTATRGGPAFTLTVNGSNFVSGAAVQWSGSPRPTTFVNAGQVTAQISADDIVVAGAENVTVVNPAPGGGTSNSQTFNIPCVLAPAGSASLQTRARLGAYYFDGWAGPLTNYHLIQLVNTPSQDRQPLSGWRDDNQCAIEQQLAWAHSFGLDFFVFDWYFNPARFDTTEDVNSAIKITHALPDRHSMQFAILYVDQSPFTITNSADWTSAVNEWIGYMTDPAYVLVNGKPLFVVIDLFAMRQAFGSSSAVNAAFGQMRAAAQAHGFPGVYIVGGLDFIGGSPVPAGTPSVDGIFADLSMAAADGYDAISLYDYASGLTNLGTIQGLQPFSDLSDTAKWIWNQGALKSPLALIPVAQVGWDPRPNQPPTPVTFWVNRTPPEVSALIGDAISWAESNPSVRPEPSPTPPIVLIQAWNELLLGSILVPTVGDGTSYGDAVATMLSSPPTQARSVLTLNDSGASDPNRNANGRLADANGAPMAGAPVSVSYTPTSGTYAQYQLSGQAPASAVQATVGFRINTDFPATWPGFWFAGPEPSNISVYQVSYVQPADGIQRVPKNNFSSGSQSWTLQGQSQIVPSDRGAGQMVQVVAASNQSATLDSAPFPITGAASFQISFAARIPPSSSGSGYFILAFKDANGNFVPILGPNSNDLKSETIPFSPGKLSVGVATTDSAGNYQLSLTSLGTSLVTLTATYPGDSQHWPAYARIGP
jgi:glycosyl transferase family WbsX